MAVIEAAPELRAKLGPEGTRGLIELINAANGELEGRVVRLVGEKFEARVQVLEERFERRLSEEVGKINERITQEVAKINERMALMESRLTRWAFLFWVGQLMPILAILLAVILKG